MKHTLLVTLRYSESLIATIRPQFFLQYSKHVVFATILVFGAMFFTFPLWTIGWAGIGVWCAVICSGILIVVRASLLYRFSCTYLTNERLIDVDRKALLRKEVNEYPLSMIQEVRYYSTGVRSLMARAGTVVISPSSERGYIELRYVKNPEAIKELILRTCKRHSGTEFHEEL